MKEGEGSSQKTYMHDHGHEQRYSECLRWGGGSGWKRAKGENVGTTAIA